MIAKGFSSLRLRRGTAATPQATVLNNRLLRKRWMLLPVKKAQVGTPFSALLDHTSKPVTLEKEERGN